MFVVCSYDWVKDAKRLPVWYYIALQVCFDVLVLVALRIIDGSDIPSVVYFICVGKGTYSSLVWLCLMCSYFCVFYIYRSCINEICFCNIAMDSS